MNKWVLSIIFLSASTACAFPSYTALMGIPLPNNFDRQNLADHNLKGVDSHSLQALQIDDIAGNPKYVYVTFTPDSSGSENWFLNFVDTKGGIILWKRMKTENGWVGEHIGDYPADFNTGCINCNP